ncbi:MAG: ABC transporter ATP-binding protein [Clostridiales bacterium]|nr:ABC transporter ATP-binding protein [Clostridiales bacterium]
MPDILRFDNFRLDLQDDEGRRYNLLDDISFTLPEGKALGIVGESGCGKSITSLAVMRLLPAAARVTGGSVSLKGMDLMSKTPKEMGDIRGRDVAMVFQDPMTCLNPVLTIGLQIGEAIRRHNPQMAEPELKAATLELLHKVGIPNPEKRMKNYPHQFSGGMRQRTMIAMAIACSPALLIADEATTALDVTIQAQVLDLMVRLKEGGSLMFITHNLGIVAEVCDEVTVMYAGQIVEAGTVEEVFLHPAHPYTKGLLLALPTLRSKGNTLYNIPGVVPTVRNFTPGCRYAPRCDYKLPVCSERKPARCVLNDRHHAACYLYEEVMA